MKKINLIKIPIILVVICLNYALAAPVSKISIDLSNVMKQISKISNSLNHKHQEQQNLDQAIKISNEAILQSQETLKELIKKRDIDKKQLEQIRSDLFKIHQKIEVTQESIRISISNIYQQLKLMQNESSILAGNDSLNYNRKKTYLIAILNIQQKKFQELNLKLNELNLINNKLQKELDRLNKKLNDITEQKNQLIAENKDKLVKKQIIQQQIVSEQQFLFKLKLREKELNKLIDKISVSKGANREYENSSSFLNRKLYKPVNAKILLGFGARRNSIINNGILFEATNNEEVYSIANGRVMFVGNLPGFGQLVVIDNGDNYIAIYSGLIPRVKKGDVVKAGQIIANAGYRSNQPLGGVYFELRHLGKPVNPSSFGNE